MTEPKFYILLDGETVGPVTAAWVLDAARSGRVGADTSVCAVGATEWRRVADQPPLSTAFAPAGAATTPPVTTGSSPHVATEEPSASSAATGPRFGQRALNAFGALIYAAMAFGLAWVTFAEFLGVGVAAPGSPAAHEWAWRPSVPCAVVAFAVGYWFEARRSFTTKTRRP